jgi:hypothetical protein
MFVIFFGLGICMVVIVTSFPADVSLSDGLRLAGSLGKLNVVDTSFNLWVTSAAIRARCSGFSPHDRSMKAVRRY